MAEPRRQPVTTQPDSPVPPPPTHPRPTGCHEGARRATGGQEASGRNEPALAPDLPVREPEAAPGASLANITDDASKTTGNAVCRILN